MLIRFGASNALSIRDYQEISFIASSYKDKGVDLISIPNLKERLLPTLLIYGANASGKSNVLANIGFFVGAIVSSYKVEPSGAVPLRKFALDPKYENKPSQFDCDFIFNKTRFHYGFVVNNGGFEEEWLYAFPNGNRQQWFRRSKGEKLKFGKFLKGRNQFIADVTRPNSLFLSAAAQSNHKQLLPIYNFFNEAVNDYDDFPPIDNRGRGYSEKLDSRIISFLKSADTGIETFKIIERKPSERSRSFVDKITGVLSSEFPNADLSKIQEELSKSLTFGHRAISGDPIYLDMGLESRGTIQLLRLLHPIFKSLDRGHTLIIDEIDTSLHTALAEQLLRLFSSKKTNPKGAQLVATTHDTNLLQATCLRRDQIWFAEKDKGGATTVYPLSDIKTRNTDNLERGYLEGRFGAVPYVR